MPKGLKDIRFPLGGVSKRAGFQDQEPFTCPAAQNVRGIESNSTSTWSAPGRARGGSRPGLKKVSGTLLGTTDITEVRMLAEVPQINTLETMSLQEDNASDALEDGYLLYAISSSASGYYELTSPQFDEVNGQVWGPRNVTWQGVPMQAIADIVVTEPMTWELTIGLNALGNFYGKYRQTFIYDAAIGSGVTERIEVTWEIYQWGSNSKIDFTLHTIYALDSSGIYAVRNLTGTEHSLKVMFIPNAERTLVGIDVLVDDISIGTASGLEVLHPMLMFSTRRFGAIAFPYANTQIWTHSVNGGNITKQGTNQLVLSSGSWPAAAAGALLHLDDDVKFADYMITSRDSNTVVTVEKALHASLVFPIASTTGSYIHEVGGRANVNGWSLEHVVSAPSEEPKRVLVAVAENNLYRMLEDLTFEQVNTTVSVRGSYPLDSVPHNQKLFIADREDLYRTIGTTATINTSDPPRLSVAAVSDWSNLGIDTTNDLIELSNPTGAAIAGVFSIYSIFNKTYLELGPDYKAAGGGAGTADYHVNAAPKVFDPSLDTLSVWMASSGQIPLGCDIICRYRDRIALAGHPLSPQIIFFSRSGDPYDWDYGASYDDAGRAVYTQTGNAGEIGAPITALVPFSDDFLVIGCNSSLWVMRGDLTYGGRIDNLSREVGIVSKRAWCSGPSGEIFFMSRDGLFVLQPGATSVPVRISDSIPDDLKGLSPKDYEFQMAYDGLNHGLHLLFTWIHYATDGGLGKHYWLDLDHLAFWPVVLQPGHEPYSIFQYHAESSAADGVLLGTREGYVCKFDENEDTDGGFEIDSWVNIGPLSLGKGAFSEGVLSEIVGVLGAASGPVDWEIYGGDYAEDACNNALLASSASASGAWLAGANKTDRQRVRASAIIIRLKNGAVDAAWTVEQILAVVKEAGRQRMV